MNIHNVLKEKRKEFSLTQEELAEKISVSPKTISNWENGKTNPDLESLILLAQLFHLSLDNLLLGDSQTVAEMNKDLKKGRKILKIIVTSILVTISAFSIGLLIYEESTKHYRQAYEEHVRNQYTGDSVNDESASSY
ncbi:helix-turn-helix transcriptional regulator [Enterococcus sp. LJL120]